MASKYKKNKAKFKWTKELIILIVALVAILATTIVLSIPSAKTKTTEKLNSAIVAATTTDSEGNTISYDQIPLENVFEEIEHDDLIEKIAEEEYVYVLYGSTNSTEYLEQLAYINATATEEEIKTVYLYSSLWVEETEDLETETFKEKQSAIEKELNASKDSSVDDFTLLEYPAILVYNNGKLVYNSQKYNDVEQYNWFMYIQKALMISKNNE